jgi:hypothetical protein
MGASGWNHIAEYRGDVEASLEALQQSEFDQPDSFWRWELAEWDVPMPATLDELFSEPYEEFHEGHGTHSIIDVGFEDFEPLDPVDLVDTFGSERPDRSTFERVAGEHFRNLKIFVPERGYGCYVVLYQGETPTEVAFWGFSGD